MYEELRAPKLIFRVYDKVADENINRLSEVGTPYAAHGIEYPDDHKLAGTPLTQGIRGLEIRTDDGNDGWVIVRFMDERELAVAEGDKDRLNNNYSLKDADAENNKNGYIGRVYLTSGVGKLMRIDKILEVSTNVLVVECWL